MALRLYLEGMGIRAIGRALNINFMTIYYWIKKPGSSVHIPGSQEPLDAVDLGEIHTYIGQKER